MDLYVLDKMSREIVGIVDGYESVLWNLRYYDVGDFEIYVKASAKTLALLQHDNYVVRFDSDMVGIIEHVKIETDPEKGDYIIVTGRDAKSLLDRRIIWSMTTLTGTVEEGIRKLIEENLINPVMEARKMESVVLGASHGFTETMEAQYTGDNLLEVVKTLCVQNEYGFKVMLNNNRNFEFQLYKGVDRSYNQSKRPYVVFSPAFENIVTSNYECDKSTLKNACNVAGEGEGINRKTCGVGSSSGFNRREIFVDARDITSTGEDDTVMTTEEYNSLLIARGNENLAENRETITFEGEVESIRQYVYKRDYDLGDIVTVQNNYGITSYPRIIEIIESHDQNGAKIIPAFETMEVYE